MTVPLTETRRGERVPLTSVTRGARLAVHFACEGRGVSSSGALENSQTASASRNGGGGAWLHACHHTFARLGRLTIALGRTRFLFVLYLAAILAHFVLQHPATDFQEVGGPHFVLARLIQGLGDQFFLELLHFFGKSDSGSADRGGKGCVLRLPLSRLRERSSIREIPAATFREKSPALLDPEPPNAPARFVIPARSLDNDKRRRAARLFVVRRILTLIDD